MASPTPSDIGTVVRTDTEMAGDGQLPQQAPMADNMTKIRYSNYINYKLSLRSLRRGNHPQTAPMPDDVGHLAVPIDEQRCLLYMVPEQICRTDREMHKPSYISIGPYHYQGKGLHNRSQLWKAHCKQQVVEKLAEQGRRSEELEHMAREIGTDVKNYYGTKSFPCGEINSDEAFNEMMITDGCFLLVTTLHDTISQSQSDNPQHPAAVHEQAVIPNQWDNLFRWHDVVRYENQLPFHVVREIFKLIHPNEDPLQKVGKVLADSALIRYTRRKVTDPGNANNVLHLCHKLLAPTHPNRSANGVVKTSRWRRATEYRKLLVEFKKREIGSEGEAQCISDVKVVGGNVVEIPSFDLSPESCVLLRNLMLLENANKHLGGHVTSYCNFISQLACTGADVSLLTKTGIVVHSEASDEAAARKLGNLCDQIIYDPTDDYLKSDWDKLEKHCRSPGLLVRAKVFGYKDWKNPLVWIGALAAVALLVCAILQTMYTIKAYKDQTKHRGHK
uniref:Uncharacterized protein n=1 Tax=Oryza punctata TaxID=4537 RepID=A0A0E0M868_ORYPU